MAHPELNAQEHLDASTDADDLYELSDRPTPQIRHGSSHPRDQAYGAGATISMSAAAPVRSLVKQERDGGLGAMAIGVVEVQLALHRAQNAALSTGAVPGIPEPTKDSASTLFAATLDKVERLLAQDLEDGLNAVEELPDGHVKDTILSSYKVPYPVFMSTKGRGAADVDDWILQNEHHVRAYLHARPGTWQSFLVPLSAFPSLFDSPETSSVTPHARVLPRPSDLPGYGILDRKCPASRTVHRDSASFTTAWDRVTGGILRGLDWSNVCVAGGIVLGTLLNVPRDDATEQAAEDLKQQNSDIDLYLYGLDPPALNAKLEHIEAVYRRNLPEGAPMLVTRNSRTVTFFSAYPTRRVQVVLKRTQSPTEVLLNFDLDCCAVAWDGAEVWMLPRAVRALQTSYNVFTMDLPEGHWLGDRRASQEQRVFKYADKGFGIRFLPSYISILESHELDLAARADKARARFQWIFRRLTRYYGWNNMPPNKNDGIPETALDPALKVPVWTHALVDPRCANAAEPGGRSCLTSFDLLMRHVGMWETECDGKLIIDDKHWATDAYARCEGNSYDDAPSYTWDKDFSPDGYKAAIDAYNLREWCSFRDNLKASGIHPSEAYHQKRPPNDDAPQSLAGTGYPVLTGHRSHTDAPPPTHENRLLSPSRPTLQRMSYGATLAEAFATPMVLALFVPVPFAEYARTKVTEALRERGLPEEPTWLRDALKEGKRFPNDVFEGEDITLVYWTISKTLMWQKIDRRIDEVFEMLWAFMRANACLDFEPETRTHLFRVQATRRAARPTRSAVSEQNAFVRWVETLGPEMDAYMAVEQGFFSDDDQLFELWYAGKPVMTEWGDEEEEADADWRPGWEGMNGLDLAGTGEGEGETAGAEPEGDAPQ